MKVKTLFAACLLIGLIAVTSQARVKPGTCPLIGAYHCTSGGGPKYCKYDNQCSGTRKCCPTDNCGGTKCKAVSGVSYA